MLSGGGQKTRILLCTTQFVYHLFQKSSFHPHAHCCGSVAYDKPRHNTNEKAKNYLVDVDREHELVQVEQVDLMQQSRHRSQRRHADQADRWMTLVVVPAR